MGEFKVRLSIWLSIWLLILGWSVPTVAQTDMYVPYLYADKWMADTLFLGPSFRYTGIGPIKVSLQFSESTTDGRLYAVKPTTDERVFLMTNGDPIGTTVVLSDLLTFAAGEEVVFMYITAEDNVPRYTGPSLPGSRYFNTVTSDNNLNPRLRFGRRLSVAGRVRPGVIELGFEDSPQSFTSADMDFNDVHFLVEGLEILIYAKVGRKRAYIW
jgi:hypothetical protein